MLFVVCCYIMSLWRNKCHYEVWGGGGRVLEVKLSFYIAKALEAKSCQNDADFSSNSLDSPLAVKSL